jgi:hypothetical protein
MLGHALDFYIPGVSLEHLREIGLRLQRGGVGFYPTSGSPFVHMDTGGVRMWPRMTHEELARVFPDGRTVHIPSDGKPLPGYAVALAEIAKHGSAPSEMSLDAARGAGVKLEPALASNTSAPVDPIAKLLARDSDEEEDEAAPPTSRTVAAPHMEPKPVAPVRIASAQTETKPSRVADAPTPASIKPQLVHVAQLLPAVSTSTTPAAAERAAAAATPNDIIRMRGYWQGPPDGMAVVSAARARDAALKRGEATAAAAGIGGPFRDLRDDAVTGSTLAYAEQPAAHPTAPARAASGSVALPAAPTAAGPQVRGEQALHSDEPAAQVAPNGTTIVMKRIANQIASTILSASTSSVIAIKAGARLDNPWLRAVLVAPSVHRFLTTLALGTHDFRSLAALMVKPRSAVMMTFAADPNPGLDHERFSGPAIVFVSTVSYATARTAIVQ